MSYNTKNIKTDAGNKPVPQYYNPVTDDYEPVKGSDGAQYVRIGGKNTHVSVETNATTTEQSVPFEVNFISGILNDGIDDISFNFDASTTAPGKITLKEGEVLSDFPRKCTTLYFVSRSGSQPFRAVGI